MGKDLASQEEQFSVHRSPTETLEILETLVCAIPVSCMTHQHLQTFEFAYLRKDAFRSLLALLRLAFWSCRRDLQE